MLDKVNTGVVVIDKPQKVEIQKIDSMVVLIWPGDLMLSMIEIIDHPLTWYIFLLNMFESGPMPTP